MGTFLFHAFFLSIITFLYLMIYFLTINDRRLYTTYKVHYISFLRILR